MTKEIIVAHSKFAKAQDRVPSSDFHKDFDRLNAIAKRHWAKFEELCKANGLKPLSVCSQLD